MGDLKNLAKRNSNFLKIDKGETVIVQYLSYRIIPSNLDPTKDTVQYRFNFEGKDKYWTNSNSTIMVFFDDLKQGTWVKITRGKWFSKDGVEDASKSSYAVEEVKQNENQGQASTASKQSQEKAWDE